MSVAGAGSGQVLQCKYLDAAAGGGGGGGGGEREDNDGEEP